MITHQLTAYIVDDDPAVRDSLSLMIKQEKISVKSFECLSARILWLHHYRHQHARNGWPTASARIIPA